MSAYPQLPGLDMAWSSHIVLDTKEPTPENLQALNNVFAREEAPEKFGFHDFIDLENHRAYSQDDLPSDWGRVLVRHRQPSVDNTGTATIRGIIAACHDFSIGARCERYTRALTEIGKKAFEAGAGTVVLPFGGQMFGDQPAIQLFQGVCGAKFDTNSTSGVLRFTVDEDGIRYQPKGAPAPVLIAAESLAAAEVGKPRWGAALRVSAVSQLRRFASAWRGVPRQASPA
jgi:hypothetical protein